MKSKNKVEIIEIEVVIKHTVHIMVKAGTAIDEEFRSKAIENIKGEMEAKQGGVKTWLEDSVVSTDEVLGKRIPFITFV
jgi:hypothetical protein